MNHTVLCRIAAEKSCQESCLVQTLKKEAAENWRKENE